MTVLIICASVLSAVSMSNLPRSDLGLERSISELATPYRFNVVEWELRNLTQPWARAATTESVLRYFNIPQEIGEVLRQIKAIEVGQSAGDVTTLLTKVNTLEREQDLLKPQVESALVARIEEVLQSQGLIRPGELKLNFPPVNFKLDEPPQLLVVSPLDKITTIQSVLLQANIDLSQIEVLETSVDNMGVSSLVVELGGYGATYPTFVSNRSSLEYTIETAIHEWVHQYLTFRPLGFAYVVHSLGLSGNDDIVTMNETVAGMVSSELSRLVLAQYQLLPSTLSVPAQVKDFDFDKEMRGIREAVDTLLAAGKLDDAARLMNEKRDYLETRGYYIRKLNQAYFAFHGVYGDDPAFANPIGAALETLRNKSASLKEFLGKVATMTGVKDLDLAPAP